MGRSKGFAAALGAALLAAASPVQAGAFSDWAAIFVAGDDHAHSGAHSEVFDNARRDLAIAFAKVGFSPANMAEFSVHPEKYPKQTLNPSTPDAIRAKLDQLAGQAHGGCLVYFTSHGGPDGYIVMGQGVFTSSGVASMVDEACGARATVVVISACYSGAFIPPLSGPNRMVLTAARPDRTSFGCGESDTYTFFDTCIIGELPKAHDFAALGRAAQTCVARRETEMGMAPPSEPQVWTGPALAADLPLMAFSTSP